MHFLAGAVDLLGGLDDLFLGDLAILRVAVHLGEDHLGLGLLDLGVMAHLLEGVLQHQGDLVPLQGSMLLGVVLVESVVDGHIEKLLLHILERH